MQLVNESTCSLLLSSLSLPVLRFFAAFFVRDFPAITCGVERCVGGFYTGKIVLDARTWTARDRLDAVLACMHVVDAQDNVYVQRTSLVSEG